MINRIRMQQHGCGVSAMVMSAAAATRGMSEGLSSKQQAFRHRLQVRRRVLSNGECTCGSISCAQNLQREAASPQQQRERRSLRPERALGWTRKYQRMDCPWSTTKSAIHRRIHARHRRMCTDLTTARSSSSKQQSQQQACGAGRPPKKS